MKAIAITQAAQAGTNLEFLNEITLPTPVASGHDLLVEVKAISVNPVDTKVRGGFKAEQPRVLGWDAVGVVAAVGESVTLFKPGDEVWYAGSLTRPGSNSEYQLVDERIVALKPKSIDNASAAALPLTAITAWEMLFDRLGVVENGNENDVLLIVGAAGGVGSILTQLARKLTKITVIGTASRPQSQKWVSDLGAHHVIDHSKPLTEELALIDDPETLDARPLKVKSISLHWEFMFTRSMFETSDMIEQNRLLTRVAALIDQRVIQTTLGEHLGVINAANLRRAHELIETNRTVGKIVLEGF